MVGVKHIVSWSGGKDSTATILLAKEHGEPLDEIIFSEVMFDDTISGELPEHIDFIRNVAIPMFNAWGYETKILRHDRTYMDYFNQVRQRGKHVGKKVGFPMADRCNVRNCKVLPIQKYIRESGPCIQYVGIAVEEKSRLVSMHREPTKVSLLEKYSYTEEMAKHKCAEYGLLSPYYDYSKRGGCWFCPNAGRNQLRYVREYHPVLWEKLLALENCDNLAGPYWNTRGGVSLHQMEEHFKLEQRQLSIFDVLNQ